MMVRFDGVGFFFGVGCFLLSGLFLWDELAVRYFPFLLVRFSDGVASFLVFASLVFSFCLSVYVLFSFFYGDKEVVRLVDSETGLVKGGDDFFGEEETYKKEENSKI